MTTNILEREAQFILQTYKRKPITFVRGNGCDLFDQNGRAYLDFGSGIAVNALGHNHPAVAQAVKEQTEQLLHVSNLYYSEPMVELAQAMVESSFGDKVFFCNSGTEANEAALKFARRHSMSSDASGTKTKFVTFRHGFHGRTIGALSVTPKPAIQDPFRPLLNDVIVADFNDCQSIQTVVDRSVAGVIVEPVQGEGGIHIANVEFMRKLRHACDTVGAALIFDEVQCGLGRTGSLWAYEQFGVEPDMMTLAKPLGGGLPLGAVVVNKTIASSIRYGDHGSTFGANPLATRVGLAVLRTISHPAFLNVVRANASHLQKSLHAIAASMPDRIRGLRGLGLMWGIDTMESADLIVDRALQNGLVILTAGENTIRLLPPLIINQGHIDQFSQIFTTVMNGK